jgi:hypothetical protein
MYPPENDRISARDFTNELDASKASESWRPPLADAWARHITAPDHRTGIEA